MVDESKLDTFMEKMLGDLGGALSVSLVRIGDRLGLYRTLFEQGPMTSDGLADAAGIARRYAREWCAQQAASGYLAYHWEGRLFELPPEQAMVFALPDSPVYLQGAFDLAAAMVANPGTGRGGVQDGRRRRLGRPGAMPVLRHRAVLSPGLQHAPPHQLAARAGRRDDAAGAGRRGGRRRLRPWLLDHHDGQGFPEGALHRLRFP